MGRPEPLRLPVRYPWVRASVVISGLGTLLLGFLWFLLGGVTL
jgi:hypothetical protein